ncbi:Fe-S cluster assembly ATPase SufC [Alloalcanivorax xenomutans]|jgi:Fe-S cluster assembly ATP-binding protein|uniref:ABC transporter ATP-binding protein n=2 Tax=Alcanivoracaceae TaxID=224372 RepID=A0ABT2QV24_9GAMM|nr:MULTISPECIES: Fe-S cluster assembly ATPase SufC [Alcanivoracaceae]KYZ84884.1 ABC transporter ATP-binding protein [Alcanivorax sp. KX64203]MBA4723280.1 Fe-S cluster assembly ATPase SufC [Alcanivorax sp.]KAF0806020.1 ABC transporter ATP-binding protein [Alcanivorax xiamenensis]MCE7522306.1 Fe-S cluster assembly ATPase SufC [Alloalcanivorax xenomutans]MCU5781360.1 ABC transporter ATP-binding protein [Alloalcanivorax balearicus MACL04]|tara:strand:- start:948 stop:1703 length:756 start_codon:yes stop_codon:yes gene_type:complete
MLEIRDLHAAVNGKAILKGLDLTVNPGEVHAIMGPNGSGKSTLANVLAGRDNYEITGGQAILDGHDLAELEPEERAQAGLFLAFQYPVEIPGVSNMEFLKAALEAVRKAQGKEEWDSVTLLRKAREACKQVNLDAQFLKRGVNEGFSGGEKKRNEIMQMLLMEPRLALLDETDSGLDIDALQTVARGVNSLRSPERGIVLVTHYQRLLDYIVPDHVHVLSDGRIIKSGGKELALELEQKGYGWLTGEEESA